MFNGPGPAVVRDGRESVLTSQKQHTAAGFITAASEHLVLPRTSGCKHREAQSATCRLSN